MNWEKLTRHEPTKKIIETIISEKILIDNKGLDYLVLNTALEYGRKDVVKFLLNRNCTINISNHKETRNSTICYNTPLHNAIILGDIKIVNTLLEKKSLIYALDADNNTPLHLAFLKKNNDIVDAILGAMESSSNYKNIKNKFGLTLLHIACTRNNIKVINNLLKCSGDLENSVSDCSLTWKGFTALHFAAEYKSLEAMKILTRFSSKKDIKRKNANGQTALQIINRQLEDLLLMSDLLSLDTEQKSYKNISYFHVACARDDPEVVKKLLDKGAPINTPVSENSSICSQYTPMHFAIQRKVEANIKILLEQGADIKRNNSKWMTPLHQALYTEEIGKRSSLVDLLYSATKNKENNLKDRHKLSYLHVACTRNDVDLVQKLLNKNEDVNSKVSYDENKFNNFTPLHFAVFYENFEVAQLLIGQGAKVNACDGTLYGTPLHMAFFFGNKDLVKLLLENGANPKTIRPVDKETTLSCLVYGYIAKKDDDLLSYVKRLTTEFGINVNAKDHEGDTALHIACENLRVAAPVIKLLIEFGADINSENDKGETPLMWVMNGKYNRYCNNANDYMMLYHHVQNLKTLGLEVNVKNQNCCEKLMRKRKDWNSSANDFDDETVIRIEEARSNEITRMKNIELDEDFSLYDFMLLEPERAATYVKNDGAKLYLSKAAYDENEYPIYRYLIRLLLQKVDLVVRYSEIVVETDIPIKRQRSQ